MAIFLRGVSEYIATVIMIIITLIAGLIIFLYVNSIVDTYYNSIMNRLIISEKGSIDIMASYIAGNTLNIIVSTDSHSVKIYSIYINETLYTSCKIYRGDNIGIEIEGINGIEIPYLSIAIIKCPIDNCKICNVKIVYGGGEVYAVASRIS